MRYSLRRPRSPSPPRRATPTARWRRWSSSTGRASPGAHAFTARATDNKGGTLTSAAVNVIVNVPPTVSITSPASRTLFAAPASVAIGATAADADGTIARVDFYQGATLIGTAPMAPYSVSWSGAGSGTYQLTAVATDGAGATTTSSVVTIRVNTAP